MKQGCNYTITCLICKSEGKVVQYFGESARTPFDRGSEHLAALMAENRESPLWEHMCDDHQNQPHKLEMKVSGYQIKPLNRQAEEASKIEDFNGLKYLNRPGEGGQNFFQKLSLEENLDPKTGIKRKKVEG